MSRHASLPFHFYVNVDNEFLGPQMPKGTTPAIWHGVFCREYQLLSCHVLLESGAHWSGLPLHALSTTKDFSFSRQQLMPWGAMGSEVDVWYAVYLEGLLAETHRPFQSKARHTGIMVDWKDGFSRYPAEHKPLNLLHLENGQFALLPNNYATFSDAHFTTTAARENLRHYRRGSDVYWEEAP